MGSVLGIGEGVAGAVGNDALAAFEGLALTQGAFFLMLPAGLGKAADDDEGDEDGEDEEGEDGEGWWVHGEGVGSCWLWFAMAEPWFKGRIVGRGAERPTLSG